MKDIRTIDIENPIAELFDDPAANEDERDERNKRDLEARRAANLSLRGRTFKPSRAEERDLIRQTQAELK